MSDNIASLSKLANEACRIACQLLPKPVSSVEYVPIGVMTHKFIATDGCGVKYIIRMYPESRSSVVFFEPDILQRCRRAGARVPEVITDSRSGPPALYSYMVYRMIPGDRLTDRVGKLSSSERHTLGREIVDQLQLLAELQFAGFGDLTGVDTAKDTSWATFLADAFARGMVAIRQYRLLPLDIVEMLEFVQTRVVGSLPEAHPRLVWADLSTDNTIVGTDNRLSGLIDFENALSGDSLLALGYSAAFDDHQGLTGMLMSAWPRILGVFDASLVDLYSVIRVLRIAPYRVGCLPAGQAPAPLLTIFPGFEPALRRLLHTLSY